MRLPVLQLLMKRGRYCLSLPLYTSLSLSIHLSSSCSEQLKCVCAICGAVGQTDATTVRTSCVECEFVHLRRLLHLCMSRRSAIATQEISVGVE